MDQTRAKSKASMDDFDQQSTQSGAIIGSNDDLLTEILLRLPVTSILRFKSVSKHWRFLLSDRSFTLRYDNHFKSPGIFSQNKYVPFDVGDPSTPPLLTLDSYFDCGGVRILQSCNGLLLCSKDRGLKGCIVSDKYYVFNPTTKQLALIPSVPGGLKVGKSICFMGLAFHPTDCVHYKVVLCLKAGRDSVQIQLYSSDTRKWKVSDHSFSPHEYRFEQGVYWNGSVYWAPLYCDCSCLYFKIDVEQLQTVRVPVESMSSQVLTTYLGESRGHLHLIAHNKCYQENIIPLNVYEMLSDHSGWFVKYQLQLGALPSAFPDMVSDYHKCFKFIDVVRGEEEEDTFLVLKTPQKIITYNVHHKSFKQISSCSSPMYFYEPRSMFHRYTETLSSF